MNWTPRGQLRKDTDDMITRLHSEVKASKSARQERMAEQHRQD